MVMGLACAMGIYGFQLVDCVYVTPGLCESLFVAIGFCFHKFVVCVLSDYNSSIVLLKLLYSLCPKIIVLLPEFFCPQMIVRFICPTIKLRLKVKYFCTKVSISSSLSTPQLPGAFWSSCFYYSKSHTYNYSVNDQQALISPKSRSRTIILDVWSSTLVISLSQLD